MYKDRLDDYKLLEENRGAKLLVYVTGDRPGWETQIHQEVLDFFTDHLDLLNSPQKITLLLYTRGGSTLAAWSIVNLIRMFCDEFEVVIPAKAHSSGTLISLGANAIVMTKQATLGPIDPSVNTPLNPQMPGAPPMSKVPVSVEAIKGFIELARDEMNITNEDNMALVLTKLADMVHPLVLGEVYRARTQIQMLAKKLLVQQVKDQNNIDKIISFLCSDSGSHDYTINRREARDNLGLNIIKPDDELYKLIKRIYDNIREELQLNIPYNPNALLSANPHYNYSFRRCLVESIAGGSDVFVSEGTLLSVSVPVPPGVPPQTSIQDNRVFEGWRHENV